MGKNLAVQLRYITICSTIENIELQIETYQRNMSSQMASAQQSIDQLQKIEEMQEANYLKVQEEINDHTDQIIQALQQVCMTLFITQVSTNFLQNVKNIIFIAYTVNLMRSKNY